MERGKHIAHFEILNELGAGGMGIVYRARDLVLHREVALKLIQPDRANPDFRRRFLDEARIAATLTHPGIATIHEAGEVSDAGGDEPRMYVAQELIEGETLASIAGRGPVPWARAIDFVLQLLSALSEAHAHGILHRDIKPSNLMLTRAGRLKVLDFGIAKRFVLPDETTRVEASGSPTGALTGHTIIGTPSYMAPEQLRGISDVRVDIFAAGCVLYELLTGRQLLQPTALGDAALPSAASTALRSHCPDLPDAIGAVLDRAVAFDPTARYPDATSFADALRAAVDPARSAVIRPPTRARRWLMPAVVGLAAALAAFVVWRWTQPALAFAERDLVLIASLVNETGDPAFDSAIEGALEADLQQSRYVSVFDDSRLTNVLKSMRLPATQPIDLATGRAVCSVAGIRVLLIPSIVSVGTAYQIEASLIDPSSGRTVDRLRVTAESKESVLLNGIDKLTRNVRERLGESLPAIQKSDPPLVEFASKSLDAMRFVRLGGEALAAADIPRAARAFEQALEHDPQFPAALISLGLVNIEVLNKPAEGRQLLTRALAQSTDVSEREHFMLRAIHKQFVANDPAGALEDYRFVSSLYPDMFQPYNNSGRILASLGRYEEAAVMFERAHKLDPRHTVPLWNLWDLELNRLDHPARAEQHARTLAQLQPDNPYIRHLVAWTAVALRRFDEAERITKEVLAAVPLHPFAFPNYGHLLLHRGAAREAADVYAQILEKTRAGQLDQSASDAALFLGIALSTDGRTAEARDVYEKQIAFLEAARVKMPSIYEQARLATLYAAAGHRAEAERVASDMLQRGQKNPWILYTLARTRALLGQLEPSADLLRRARAAGYDQPYFVLIDPPLRALQNHPVIGELAVLP